MPHGSGISKPILHDAFQRRTEIGINFAEPVFNVISTEIKFCVQLYKTTFLLDLHRLTMLITFGLIIVISYYALAYAPMFLLNLRYSLFERYLYSNEKIFSSFECTFYSY